MRAGVQRPLEGAERGGDYGSRFVQTERNGICTYVRSDYKDVRG